VECFSDGPGLTIVSFVPEFKGVSDSAVAGRLPPLSNSLPHEARGREDKKVDHLNSTNARVKNCTTQKLHDFCAGEVTFCY